MKICFSKIYYFPGVNFIYAKRQHLNGKMMGFKWQKLYSTLIKFHTTLLTFKTPKSSIYIAKIGI